MSRAIEARLDRLVEARREQDAATVRGVITTFLGTMTPETMYECREQATLRPKLEEFLADQSPRTLAIIERWSARRGKR